MIAITGANGLLGSMLARQLAKSNIPFFGIKRKESDTSLVRDISMQWKESDIQDITTLHEVLQDATTVIHTAALVSFKAGDGEILYKVNVEGTRNIVNTCLSLGIPKLIHVSSVAALGRQKGIYEINEENRWVDNKLNSEYAESKYLAELEVFRGQEEGLNIDIVNPSVILSQADWNKSSSQIFKYAWLGKPFYTDGAINYVDVRDVVEMIIKLINRESGGQRIIANAGVVPLKDILTKLALNFNKKPPWIRVPNPLISIAANLEYFRSLLTGNEPLVTSQSARSAREKYFYSNKKAIEELGMQFHGLNETIDWCCAHYLQNATTNN